MAKLSLLIMLTLGALVFISVADAYKISLDDGSCTDMPEPCDCVPGICIYGYVNFR